MSHRRTTTLAALVVVAGIWAVKDVSVPLAYALFALGAVEPLRRAIARRLPTWVAVLGALVVVLGVFAMLVGAIAASFQPVVEDWPEYETQLTAWREQASASAGSIGISLSDNGGRLGEQVATGVAAFVSGFTLMIGFFVLAGAEVLPYEKGLERAASRETAQKVLRAIGNCGKDVRIYLAVRTVAGLLTGGLVVAASYAIGLELPWVWGSLNFLLNYIPTIGSVLAVVPPVLFGQATGGSSQALLAFAAIGGVQLVMGVVIDPLIQGRQLALSPLAVLVSVAFWGIVWGIPGAFIATPMTMLSIRLCQQFDSSRWVYELVVRDDREETEGDGASVDTEESSSDDWDD